MKSCWRKCHARTTVNNDDWRFQSQISGIDEDCKEFRKREAPAAKEISPSEWKAVILAPLALPFSSAWRWWEFKQCFFNNFAGPINAGHLYLSWRLRTRCYKKGLNATREATQHPLFFSPSDPNCSKQGGWITQCIFQLKGRQLFSPTSFKAGWWRTLLFASDLITSARRVLSLLHCRFQGGRF